MYVSNSVYIVGLLTVVACLGSMNDTAAAEYSGPDLIPWVGFTPAFVSGDPDPNQIALIKDGLREWAKVSEVAFVNVYNEDDAEDIEDFYDALVTALSDPNDPVDIEIMPGIGPIEYFTETCGNIDDPNEWAVASSEIDTWVDNGITDPNNWNGMVLLNESLYYDYWDGTCDANDVDPNGITLGVQELDPNVTVWWYPGVYNSPPAYPNRFDISSTFTEAVWDGITDPNHGGDCMIFDIYWYRGWTDPNDPNHAVYEIRDELEDITGDLDYTAPVIYPIREAMQSDMYWWPFEVPYILDVTEFKDREYAIVFLRGTDFDDESEKVVHCIGDIVASDPNNVDFVAGDVNCSGACGQDDITPFTNTLIYGRSWYYTNYPNCHYCHADVNRDGKVDQGDINPFVALLN